MGRWSMVGRPDSPDRSSTIVPSTMPDSVVRRLASTLRFGLGTGPGGRSGAHLDEPELAGRAVDRGDELVEEARAEDRRRIPGRLGQDDAGDVVRGQAADVERAELRPSGPDLPPV